MDDLNERPFQKLDGTRASAFERLDKPAMRPLPRVRYELADRRNARVNIDYHVEYERRYYSVPHRLVHEAVELRATAGIVEIFLREDDKKARRRQPREHDFKIGDRVATHKRSYAPAGTAVTELDHRPVHHHDQVWPPERLVNWGRKFGPAVATVVEQMLARYAIPEQGYRACLGLLRSAERHGGQRMNDACERALAVHSNPNRRYIEAILKRGLDRQAHPASSTRQTPHDHENIRGGDYYDKKETMH